jgi:hypothetical protein
MFGLAAFGNCRTGRSGKAVSGLRSAFRRDDNGHFPGLRQGPPDIASARPDRFFADRFLAGGFLADRIFSCFKRNASAEN